MLYLKFTHLVSFSFRWSLTLVGWIEEICICSIDIYSYMCGLLMISDCLINWCSKVHTFWTHDDVIKHFPRYWPFVRGIHRSPVNSTQKGQCHGALTFSFICTWINGCVNNRETGDLRRHRSHYGVTVTNGIVFTQKPTLSRYKIYNSNLLNFEKI